MKIQMRQVVAVVMVAGFLMMGCFVNVASAREGFHRRMGEKMFEVLVEELNLSAEQQTRIREQRERQESVQRERHHRSRELREQLRIELEKETTNHARIEQLAAQIKQLMVEGIDARIQGVLGMKEILSPEQFKKLNARTREMREQKKRELLERFSE